MSLPPYKHTRNPALERENEFYEYKSWEAPLITYDGIVEKRKTTDLKLIRNQPQHPGIELEYLSPLSVEKSLQPSTKNLRESRSNTGRLDSRDDLIKNNEVENKIASDELVNRRSGVQEDDAKSTRSQRSIKTRESASRESLISRSSARSSSTAKSRTSTVQKILDEPAGSIKPSRSRESRGFTSKSRYSANGLDEDDQFRR